MNNKKPHLIVEEHYFAKDKYICSVCGYVDTNEFDVCPSCGAHLEKKSTDPKWADELEIMDEIFDDE